MRKLRSLQVLDLNGRCLEAVPGFDCLISLQEVMADFREVVEWPSLRQLIKLQKLKVDGWSLAGIRGLDNMTMLHSLHIHGCSCLDELPDFRSLISLQALSIKNCEFKDVSELCNLSALESLRIRSCDKLEKLSDLQGLTRLKSLEIKYCFVLRVWDCTLGQVFEGTKGLSTQRATNLQTLILGFCGLANLRSIGTFSHLESFECWSLPVEELPDLSNFPQLKSLLIFSCKSLRRLRSHEPMKALLELNISQCSNLTTLPDLCNFPGLLKLDLLFCDGITTLSSSGPLTALTTLGVESCNALKALPDLERFPILKELVLNGCSGLTALNSSVVLAALKWLDARGCKSLSPDDLDQLQALCPQCQIDYEPLGHEVDEVVEKTWGSRLLRCFRR